MAGEVRRLTRPHDPAEALVGARLRSTGLTLATALRDSEIGPDQEGVVGDLSEVDVLDRLAAHLQEESRA